MLKLRRNIILVPTLLAIVAASGCAGRTDTDTAPSPSVTGAASAGPSPINSNGPATPAQQEQQARIEQYKQMMQQRGQLKPPAPQ